MKAPVFDAEAGPPILGHSTVNASFERDARTYRSHFVNPIDPLYVAHPLARSGRTNGSGFAGTVAGVGLQVPVTNGFTLLSSGSIQKKW